ncbi:MAG: hypothetical protein ACP5FQ_07830, partial [Thermoplasmata archaeon]
EDIVIIDSPVGMPGRAIRNKFLAADVPNAFIQAQMPNLDDANERVFMKITGVLVDLLVEMAPEV